MSKAANGYKICSKCKECKPVSEFYKHKATPDSLFYACKRCSLARTRVYNEAHKEERRAQQQDYFDTERGKQASRQGSRRRRARKAGAEGFHTYEEFVSLCEALDFRCQGCGGVLPLDDLTEDHIIPLSRGGSDDIDNIQPLCFSCNSSKSSRTMEEWIASFCNTLL